VHIISRKTLRLFWEQHPDSQSALLRWYKAMHHAKFRTFAELREVFPLADTVDRWIVFNVGGNKYRLIASIHFNRDRVYVRHVLSHKEYDRGSWKQ
jgi:mRNA interferase HigB